MRLFRGPKRREVTGPRAVATPSPRRDAAAADIADTGPHVSHDFTLVTALPAMVMEDDVKEMKKGTTRCYNYNFLHCCLNYLPIANTASRVLVSYI